MRNALQIDIVYNNLEVLITTSIVVVIFGPLACGVWMTGGKEYYYVTAERLPASEYRTFLAGKMPPEIFADVWDEVLMGECDIVPYLLRKVWTDATKKKIFEKVVDTRRVAASIVTSPDAIRGRETGKARCSPSP